MYLERHDFSLTLELLSDLHIGDGDAVPLSELRPGAEKPRNAAGEEFDPLIATLVRDHSRAPWLPPTSLKGAFRGLDAVEGADRLVFGIAPDGNKENGTGGKLYVWGGTFKDCSKQENLGLPLWDAAKQSFVITQVAIDRDRATAEAGQLFFTEYLPAGLRFTVECCWLGTDEEIQGSVLPLLNRLAREDGFSLGAGSGVGFGKARLIDGEVEVISKELSVAKNGVPSVKKSKKARTISLEPPPQNLRLRLHCPGPFLLVDPRSEGEDEHTDLFAYQRDAAKAELLGTSLTGVIRARASWLQQTRMGLGRDQRGDKYDPGKPEQNELTPCQSLFGVNGWARKLRIAQIKHVSEQAEQHTYPGLKLDDFTQGVMAGATFAAKAPGDVTFIVDFELGTKKRSLDEQEILLLTHILSDAQEIGWKIGHSTGVGFGWFNVSQEWQCEALKTTDEQATADV